SKRMAEGAEMIAHAIFGGFVGAAALKRGEYCFDGYVGVDAAFPEEFRALPQRLQTGGRRGPGRPAIMSGCSRRIEAFGDARPLQQRVGCWRFVEGEKARGIMRACFDQRDN